MVSELSRLDRSVGQIIQIVDTLIKKKSRFVAVKESIKINGKQDIQTKTMITMFGLEALLKNGNTKTFIAKRYKTSLPNLYRWMKKHGVN